MHSVLSQPCYQLYHLFSYKKTKTLIMKTLYSKTVKFLCFIGVDMYRDDYFLKEAVKQAKKALSIGDVPIGCVIVFEDKIIARGYNRRNKDKSTLSHAEIIAIKKACKKMGDWRLEDCTMYITLEPCPMCAGAIVQSRIKRAVLGAMNPKAGCAGSVLNILQTDGFNHKTEVELISSESLQNECSLLLSSFFKSLRQTKSQ